LDLIEKKFGADGVRVGLLLSASEEYVRWKLCKKQERFTNKIWNAFKLLRLGSFGCYTVESSKVAMNGMMQA
jgi:valyl-tRNA synthetase